MTAPALLNPATPATPASDAAPAPVASAERVMTSTEARWQFTTLLTAVVQDGAHVHIQRFGKDVAVVVPAALYGDLLRRTAPPARRPLPPALAQLLAGDTGRISARAMDLLSDFGDACARRSAIDIQQSRQTLVNFIGALERLPGATDVQARAARP